MTANQIAYWNYVEKKRNNRAVETETNRANIARETETNRANRMREYQTFQQRMQDRELKRIDQRELERSHRASEWRDYWALEEQKRHNRATEGANIVSANAQMLQAQNNQEAVAETRRSNAVKERQAQQQINSQANLNQAKVYQGYRANELQAAFTYGNLQESRRSNVANEELKRIGLNIEEARNTEVVRHNLAQEREIKRHNQQTESAQNVGNIINAGQLFVSFKRQKADEFSNTVGSIAKVGFTVAKLTGGAL